MRERFRFSDGRKMNPFWVDKTMSPKERTICARLSNAGLLGWNRASLKAAHIKEEDIDILVNDGVLICVDYNSCRGNTPFLSVLNFWVVKNG